MMRHSIMGISIRVKTTSLPRKRKGFPRRTSGESAGHLYNQKTPGIPGSDMIA